MSGHPSTWPIVSGLSALIASTTIQEWAAIAGICGVVMGIVFGWRRDRRERIAFEYATGKRQDRRTRAHREVD